MDMQAQSPTSTPYTLHIRTSCPIITLSLPYLLPIALLETLVAAVIYNSMPERKPWSEREDGILRVLKQQRGVKKWSEIAKLMETEFGVRQRTGKQCRERYHNHLDATIVTTEWSPQEEATLSAAHTEVGNKWSVIAQRLPGRSDNCVKNHFYSKLRKSLRRLNRAIHHKYKKEYRDFKLPLLNRIVQTTEERFKLQPALDPQAVQQSLVLTQRLFGLEQVGTGEEGEREEKWLMEELARFQALLRRASRSMKEHKASIETNCGKENGEEPYLQIFKRVCAQLMHDQQ